MTATVEMRMQQAAERRLADVAEAHDRLEEDGTDAEAAEVAGLWCGGCDTCVVREVLEAAVPILLDAIRAGEVSP